MDIATVFLKDNSAPGSRNWDKGEFVRSDAFGVTLRGNGMGDDTVRTYPAVNIQRVEHRSHW